MAGARAAGDTECVRPTAVVVDDHPAFRRMAGLLLRAAGFCVVGEAADVADAVAAIREIRPSFVLLDVLLPDGSGIDVADRVAGPDGPVVLLTSSRSAEELGPVLADHEFVTKSKLTVERLRVLATDE
jgi:CheY-like chemotaxis protein